MTKLLAIFSLGIRRVSLSTWTHKGGTSGRKEAGVRLVFLLEKAMSRPNLFGSEMSGLIISTSFQEENKLPVLYQYKLSTEFLGFQAV